MLHQSVPRHPIMLHIRSHHMKWHHITSHQLICWQVIIWLLPYQLTGWLAMQCDLHPQLSLTWALVWSHLIISLLLRITSSLSSLHITTFLTSHHYHLTASGTIISDMRLSLWDCLISFPPFASLIITALLCTIFHCSSFHFTALLITSLHNSSLCFSSSRRRAIPQREWLCWEMRPTPYTPRPDKDST